MEQTTKAKIVALLEVRPYTVKELISKLKVSKWTIKNVLYAKNLVIISKREGKKVSYFIPKKAISPSTSPSTRRPKIIRVVVKKEVATENSDVTQDAGDIAQDVGEEKKDNV